MLSRLKRQLRKHQANRIIKKIYYPFEKKWIKGKRVALIGGADSVLEEELGPYIDDFDIVVRINKGVELIEHQKKFVGTRTDLLFHSFFDNPNEPGSSPITADLWKKQKVGKVIYAANFNCVDRGIYDVILFNQKTSGTLSFTQIPEKIYQDNIEKIAPYNPTTGYTAINTLINCFPKELYITGMTFFKSPHNRAYAEKGRTVKEEVIGIPGQHNPEAELNYFLNVYQNYPEIIKTDKPLFKIIQEQQRFR